MTTPGTGGATGRVRIDPTFTHDDPVNADPVEAVFDGWRSTPGRKPTRALARHAATPTYVGG